MCICAYDLSVWMCKAVIQGRMLDLLELELTTVCELLSMGARIWTLARDWAATALHCWDFSSAFLVFIYIFENCVCVCARACLAVVWMADDNLESLIFLYYVGSGDQTQVGCFSSK